jgi:hypothetical protein
MNKFNIGDEVQYTLKGKIDKIERFDNKVLYQIEGQCRDVWLEEENIEYAKMPILREELEMFHLLTPTARERVITKLTRMHEELQHKEHLENKAP